MPLGIGQLDHPEPHRVLLAESGLVARLDQFGIALNRERREDPLIFVPLKSISFSILPLRR